MYLFSIDTVTTEIYTLSLHDALPIYRVDQGQVGEGLGEVAQVPAGPGVDLLGVEQQRAGVGQHLLAQVAGPALLADLRSEEHTSELQSHVNLVCRLLLEKKKALLFRC